MRFRVRCTMPGGAPGIVKYEGSDPFAAVAYAGEALKREGHSLSAIKQLRVGPMKDAKQGALYIGSVPKSRPRRRPAGDASAAVETANAPGSSEAVVAAGKAETTKTETPKTTTKPATTTKKK